MFIIPTQPELSLLGLLQLDAQVLSAVRGGIASPIDSVPVISLVPTVPIGSPRCRPHNVISGETDSGH